MVQNTNSRRVRPQLARVFFPLRANGLGEKDIFLTINCSWLSRLAIFSKLVALAISAFSAVGRWRRRGRVIAKGHTRREVRSGVVSEQELEKTATEAEKTSL
jgi:hypothetical protein